MTPEQEPLEVKLRRLHDERDTADRRYNEALTELDRSVMRLPELPHPPPPYDDRQLAALNGHWEIATRPAGGGLRARLASAVWRFLQPALQKQTTFNSTLVDHLNRNVTAHQEAQRAIASTVALIRDQLTDLVAFQSRLIQYLQQITAYVDTRDRDAAGQALVVNSLVNGVADDMTKRWESSRVRDQRFDARLLALTAAHEELRTGLAAAQRAALTVKRELERVEGGPLGARVAPSAEGDRSASNADSAFASALDSYKYLGFEEQFRGSEEAIRERLESYIPHFEGASEVLDVGCGRGEFLELLKARGITARGLDLNHEMTELCRVRGLDVTEADAVSYLNGVPDASLGGLFAAQVVEHLQPGYLLRFLELAFHKMRPDGTIVLETLNPSCWVAFFDSFIRDITHVWPLHPETLRYLVTASGFTSARIEFRSPVAAQDRLETIAAPEGSVLAAFVDPFNANVEKLNERLFTYLDYAVIGRK